MLNDYFEQYAFNFIATVTTKTSIVLQTFDSKFINYQKNVFIAMRRLGILIHNLGI